ncbi:odorant receptor 301 [Nasonia vitripennis]|uniref:Odorant receptor n=1 Tax=Nasonia vitripennis TaxID=7425 RepID=A0A7M6UM54_NASVI|nr:odorant receptor 301 [Nasonia vitripennis]
MFVRIIILNEINFLGNMDSEIYDSEYYHEVKLLLTYFGLWPNLSRFRKVVSFIAMVAMPISLVIPMSFGLKRAIRLKEPIQIIEDTIGILYFLAITTKYICIFIFEGRMIVVYEQIASDWKKIKDKNELEYLHGRAKEGKIITILYLGYGAVGCTIFASTPYLPLFLDLVIPLNVSRDKIYPYYADYVIVDSEKYFYTLYTLHGIFIIILVTMSAISIDCLFIMMVKHSVGLFQIVCYRLKKIGEEHNEKPHECKRLMDDKIIHTRMKEIFDSHKSSIECVDAIQASFDVSFLFIMTMSGVGVSLILFDLLLNLDDLTQILRINSMMFGVYIAVFVICYAAQMTLNSSEIVFNDTYCGYWYNISPNARKYTQMVMVRSMKPCIITAGGLINMNLQSFFAILKTSVSYATVMLSMQEESNMQN